MKDETTNSYELTLTPNYVSDWNFNDGRMKIRHCMNGTTWTAHVQPWTNTRSRRRRRENNGRS